MIAVSLVLTLIGAALFVVSLFHSDDLNIVLLCIGCALLAAVFLGVGALRSRPSRKPVLASGAQDRAAPGDARTAAPQPAGATALTVLERDDEPPGWAPPKSGTTAVLPRPTQPADDTGWRRPQATPASASPAARVMEVPPEDEVEQEAQSPEDELAEGEFIDDDFPPEPEPEPSPPRAPAARRAAPAAKQPAKAARQTPSKPRATAAAKATSAKTAAAKTAAANRAAPRAPAKAATPAKAARTAPAARTGKVAAKAAKAAPVRTAKAATPARAKAAAPAKKAQAEAVEIGLSARDAARVEEVLGPVSGLGPAKRAQLLRFFGTWRRLRNASVERLAQVPGITPPLAERIRAALDE